MPLDMTPSDLYRLWCRVYPTPTKEDNMYENYGRPDDAKAPVELPHPPKNYEWDAYVEGGTLYLTLVHMESGNAFDCQVEYRKREDVRAAMLVLVEQANEVNLGEWLADEILGLNDEVPR